MFRGLLHSAAPSPSPAAPSTPQFSPLLPQLLSLLHTLVKFWSKVDTHSALRPLISSLLNSILLTNPTPLLRSLWEQPAVRASLFSLLLSLPSVNISFICTHLLPSLPFSPSLLKLVRGYMRAAPSLDPAHFSPLLSLLQSALSLPPSPSLLLWVTQIISEALRKGPLQWEDKVFFFFLTGTTRISNILAPPLSSSYQVQSARQGLVDNTQKLIEVLSAFLPTLRFSASLVDSSPLAPPPSEEGPPTKSTPTSATTTTTTSDQVLPTQIQPKAAVLAERILKALPVILDLLWEVRVILPCVVVEFFS
jgi:hypothetical protein